MATFLRLISFLLCGTIFTSACPPPTAGSYIVNVKRDFGAVGDENHDDTSSIQDAIDCVKETLRRHPENQEGIVLVPPGIYLISRPLKVEDARNLKIVGAGGGSKFLWTGDENAEALLRIENAQNCEFSHFSIEARDHALREVRDLDLRSDRWTKLALAVKICSTTETQAPSKMNVFKSIRILSGVKSLISGIQIGNQNSNAVNEKHLFINVDIGGFSQQGIKIYGENSKDHFFYNLLMVRSCKPIESEDRAKCVGIYMENGSFSMLNGGTSGNWVDFDLLGQSGPVVISQINNENSYQLLRADRSRSGLPLDITIEGSRFTREYDYDDPFQSVIKCHGQGFISLTRNLFDSSNDSNRFPIKPMRFEWEPDSQSQIANHYVYAYNFIHQNFGPDAVYIGLQPDAGIGNICPSANSLTNYLNHETCRHHLGNKDSQLRKLLEKVLVYKDSLWRFAEYYRSYDCHETMKDMIYDVAKMGARGDGIQDDTDVCARAIALASRHPEQPGLLYFPAGAYVIKKTLRVFPTRGMCVMGDGPDRTKLIWRGEGLQVGNGYDSDQQSLLLDLSNNDHAEIRDFSIEVPRFYDLDCAIRISTAWGRMPGFCRAEFCQNFYDISAMQACECVNTLCADVISLINPPLGTDPFDALNEYLKNPALLSDEESMGLRSVSFASLTAKQKFYIMTRNRLLLNRRFGPDCLPRYPGSWENAPISKANLLENIAIRAENNELANGIIIGLGKNANNDFHLLHNVEVVNYRKSGFALCNTQVYNIFFAHCRMWGADVTSMQQYGCIMGGSFDAISALGNEVPCIGSCAGPRDSSLIPEVGGMGSAAWIGGWGGNNQTGDFYFGGLGSPSVIAGMASKYSARFLNSFSEGLAVVLSVSEVKFFCNPYSNEDHPLITLRIPGTLVFESNRFSSAGRGKIYYHSYLPDWHSFSFHHNIIESTFEEMRDIFDLEPTDHANNDIWHGALRDQHATY